MRSAGQTPMGLELLRVASTEAQHILSILPLSDADKNQISGGLARSVAYQAQAIVATIGSVAREELICDALAYVQSQTVRGVELAGHNLQMRYYDLKPANSEVARLTLPQTENRIIANSISVAKAAKKEILPALELLHHAADECVALNPLIGAFERDAKKKGWGPWRPQFVNFAVALIFFALGNVTQRDELGLAPTDTSATSNQLADFAPWASGGLGNAALLLSSPYGLLLQPSIRPRHRRYLTDITHLSMSDGQGCDRCSKAPPAMPTLQPIQEQGYLARLLSGQAYSVGTDIF